MGFFRKLRNVLFPGGKQKKTAKPEPQGKKGEKAKREKRKIRPNNIREEYMDEQSGSDQYEGYSRLSHGREMMSPEIVKSFNEFSQLLHNINIKMASQNDQNMALLQSLESLPAIIRDIPRARELEGDILQEIHILLKTGHEDKLKVADRLLDIKSAMLAMEENAKAQISFFDGKERAHRDQMNMMREFIEREKKHHRNNLTGIVFIIILFIGVLCAGTFLFIREKFNALEKELEGKQTEIQMESRTRDLESRMEIYRNTLPLTESPGARPAAPQPAGTLQPVPAGELNTDGSVSGQGTAGTVQPGGADGKSETKPSVPIE